MTKFELYRFLAPFRSRLQKRLRNERLNLNFDDFMCAIEKGTECPRVVRSLWDRLREESFVEDFRPDPDDSLHKIYAMGPEEIRDELVAPIVTQLRLEMAQVDFANVTFASFDTPRAVAKFLIGIANRR